MKVDPLHAFLVAASLLAAGCASRPTQPAKPAAASAASAVSAMAGAASSPSGAAKSNAAAASNGANSSAQVAASSSGESTGQFTKVTRDGLTLYCDRNPRTGSRMSKPYCLNEDQYAAWKERNDAMKEELRRNSNPINTSNRDPGPR